MKDLATMYDQLSNNHVHYSRVTYDGNIEDFNVWTSGYKTKECMQIEKFMMQFGFVAMKRKFDRQCGKTLTYYVQQSN